MCHANAKPQKKKLISAGPLGNWNCSSLKKRPNSGFAPCTGNGGKLGASAAQKRWVAGAEQPQGRGQIGWEPFVKLSHSTSLNVAAQPLAEIKQIPLFLASLSIKYH